MLKWINKKRNKKGFTLIELVIVIAILGILIAIAVPRLGGFRDSAAKRADEATAETLERAAELYVATYTDVDKTTLSIEDLYTAKLIDEIPTPQQGEYGKFDLNYVNERFVVTPIE